MKLSRLTNVVLPFALLTLGLVVATDALAQDIPGSAQPGRIEDQFTSPEDALPAVEPGALIESAQQKTSIPEEAFNLRFVLKGIEFVGNTVYAEEELLPYYTNQLNTEIPFSMMYSLAEILTDKLRADGYLMSSVIVPAQSVDGGIIKLRFIEGFVDQINFEYEGNISEKTKKVLGTYAKKIQKEAPLTTGALERYLLLMNDLPGIEARAVVSASAATPLAADLAIIVSKDTVDGFVDINNRGTRFVGPVQGQIANYINGTRDRIGVRAVGTSNIDELKFAELSWERAVGNNGMRVRLSGSSSDSEPGHTLDSFDIKSTSKSFEARVAYPILRARAQNLEAYGTFSYRNLKTDTFDTQLNEDRIRALRAGLQWNKADQYKGVTTASVEVSQGLPIFDSTDRNSPDTTRIEAAPDFTKVEATLSREQILGKGFSVVGAATGQYSPRPLYASEEFGVGGESFGGAYDSSEITGDSGAAARIEARYTDVVQNSAWFNSVQYYAYYDFGVTNDHDPGTGVNARRTLTSVGVGTRFDVVQNIAGYVEVAKPLTRDISALNNAGDSPRVFFKLTKSW